MTRWTDTCELITRTFAVDDEGVTQETITRREVFCNSYTLSTQAWATARLADYTADDEIQLRSVDYNDEPDVVFRGKSYSIIHVMCQGDFTRLILKQYTHDIGDEDDEVIPIEPEEPEGPIEPDEDWL